MKANLYVKMASPAPWTTLSQFEHNESWRRHLGICPCHQRRKKNWWKNVVIQYIQVVSWPHFFEHLILQSLDPTNWSNPRSQQCPHRLGLLALRMMGAALHPPLFQHRSHSFIALESNLYVHSQTEALFTYVEFSPYLHVGIFSLLLLNIGASSSILICWRDLQSRLFKIFSWSHFFLWRFNALDSRLENPLGCSLLDTDQ